MNSQQSDPDWRSELLEDPKFLIRIEHCRCESCGSIATHEVAEGGLVCLRCQFYDPDWRDIE